MPTDHSQHPIDIGPYDLRSGLAEDEGLSELIDNFGHYRGKVILFLGAGASIGAKGGSGNAGLPSALALRDDIWREFLRPRDSDAAATDLGMMTLDQAAGFAEAKVGRNAVASFVSSRFVTDRCLWQHLVLKYLEPRAIFTTNYDLLIEQGWSAGPGHPRGLRLTPIFSQGQNIATHSIPLYKPHGSADRALDAIGAGGPVITTVDYFEMLTRKRALLGQWLDTIKDGCVILIGYSMSDMDIGGYLYGLRQESNGVNWYSVFPRADSTVKRYWSERLRIRPISRRYVEFVFEMDRKLGFIPEHHKYDKISGLQSHGIIQ